MESSPLPSSRRPASGVAHPAAEDPRALPALYRLTSLAGRADDPRTALRDVLGEFVATFGADAGSIALLNPGTGRLEVEVQLGNPAGSEGLGLKPGQKIEAIQYLDRVEFIPVQPIRAMRGFLKGIDRTVRRDRDRV